MIKISSPSDPAIRELTGVLAELAPELDRAPRWPSVQLHRCRDAGVPAWFVPAEQGGCDWTGSQLTEGLLALGQGCLTTTFILTQQIAAYRRIVHSRNQALSHDFLSAVAAGQRTATVGISHLTTSRQHLARPALRAEPHGSGFVLDGFSPWVTGAAHVDAIVTGAQLDDGRQVLVWVPVDTPGVLCGEPAQLVALSGSCTTSVRFERVLVADDWILAGPRENVASTGGGQTGGLQTSTLALALAQSACDFLRREASHRDELRSVSQQFEAELEQQLHCLRAMAQDVTCGSLEHLRERANSLVLRSTQAALSAAKGAGFVVGHDAGRWCREALFFLVWSCPQSVVEANLCELAGLGDSAGLP